MKRTNALVLYWAAHENRTLSYQRGWPDALGRSSQFSTELANLATRAGRVRAQLLRSRTYARRFDVVLLLHSVYSNSVNLTGGAFEGVRRSAVPKVFFIGNEYKLMPEKMAFADQLGIALLVTQIASPQVANLYQERLGCDVTYVPNTGIDPVLFAPQTALRDRPIEIGYRGFDAPWYLGSDERRRLPEAFVAARERLGLTVDISLEERDRFELEEWAAFLTRCRGTIGCEAGTDFFELDDRTRRAVNAYTATHPNSSFADVFERFFSDYEARISGRTISGRIVEAAAAGTAQILVEGEYAGHFEPGEHFIPLRRDMGDLDEAVSRLRDDAEATRLANAARDVALAEFAWPQLVNRVHRAVASII